MTDQPQHVPVMPAEIVEWLAPRPGDIVCDGTLGGGGHTRLLAAAVGDGGDVIAMDRDPAAIAAAEQNLRGLPVKLVQGNYCDLPEVLKQLEIETVRAILLDLGLSSDQLADRRRGFSFDSEGDLDLRFNPEEGEPAWRMLERLSQEDLANVIYQYGEERYSRRIAREVVSRRRENPVRTASQLAEVCRRCVPRSRGGHTIDPATRTFQAMRIAVNEELKWVEVALRRLPGCLNRGGRIAVISFHSLEDRLVKNAFRDDERLRVLTKKPLTPTEEEVAVNPRSRSAKLRVAERN